MSISEDILTSAISWVGVPYRKSGRDRTRGVDCLNFVGMVLLESGVVSELPAHQNYEYGFWRRPGDTILESFDDTSILSPNRKLLSFEDLPRNEWLPGDILCLSQLKRLEKATHVVIVESIDSHSTHIIHARQGRDGAVERTQMDRSWRPIRLFRII